MWRLGYARVATDTLPGCRAGDIVSVGTELDGRSKAEGGAFKRPAAAVWGNGLWGSVGATGRSYD